MTSRQPTTKDIALLKQLFDSEQLMLAPEFQRNNVWPRAAKAYLVDTILHDRPIPLLFFQRITSAQTGRPAYAVIDGQQRLRAIFEFLDNRFRLMESERKERYYNKRFQDLPSNLKDRIYNYAFAVQELVGYSERDIKDMFIRMNRYVVKLSQQELRHAKHGGKFYDFVERLGKLAFWREGRVFSPRQLDRMRAVEFAAELTVLLIEGPQDKKRVLDLYYGQYQSKFPYAKRVDGRLHRYMNWVKQALPNFSRTRYRSPVDLYALVGALDEISGGQLSGRLPNPAVAGVQLMRFQTKLQPEKPRGEAARYLVAVSRQTDNIIPRRTRIDILKGVISGA